MMPGDPAQRPPPSARNPERRFEARQRLKVVRSLKAAREEKP
jgi:hypothetical protein